MIFKINIIYSIILLICFGCNSAPAIKTDNSDVCISTKNEFTNKKDSLIIAYKYNLNKSQNNSKTIAMFWKDDKNKIIGNANKLKTFLKSKDKELVFAVNAGMYTNDQKPLGLFIQNGQIINELNTLKNSYGNFYMQPKGVFVITNSDSTFICKSSNFQNSNIKFATQSGPMLIINGEMHPKFTKGSKYLHIRNGVGILPNG